MISPNKVCAVCKKGYGRAFSRSHSMQATIRKLRPNLQWFTLPNRKRIKACTKCIKSYTKGKVKLPARCLT